MTESEGWGLGLVGSREGEKLYHRNRAHYNQGVGRKLSQQGLRASMGPVFWAYKEPVSVSEQRVFLKAPSASYFPVYTSTQDLTTLWVCCKIHITPLPKRKAHHRDGYYLVYPVAGTGLAPLTDIHHHLKACQACIIFHLCTWGNWGSERSCHPGLRSKYMSELGLISKTDWLQKRCF